MQTHIYTTPTSIICIDEETGKAIWQLTTWQVAALRAAAEQMAERLREMKKFRDAIGHDTRNEKVSVSWINLFDENDAAALEALERVSK
jgi:hypothetical protein